MKRINIIGIIILLVFSSACQQDEFLDIELLDRKADENFYSTPEEAEEALVGCYDGLQRMWNGGTAMNLASDVMSDQCFGGTGAADADNYPMMDEFDQSVSPGDQNLFDVNWGNYYAGIFRCNRLILALTEEVEWSGEESEKQRILAEARFLRAYFYFDLVRMFERIPLLTEPTEEIVPQSEPEEVYAVITEDLLFAIENIPALTYAEIPQGEFGHATKWAAQSLLTRVYLYYTGHFGENDLLGMVAQSDALGFVEDVIANSGHALVDTFAHLFPSSASYLAATQGKPIDQNSYAGETNSEVVFSIKYTYTHQHGTETADIAEWNRMIGLRAMKVPQYGYDQGWGACSVVPEFYQDFDENDTRRDASIMAIEEEGINYDPADDKEYTGYYTKKYTGRCNAEGESLAVILGGPDWQYGQYQDFFVIRYADVLLMAAELGSPNALDYVNDVRERAGLDPVSEVTKDVIFEERSKEFAFEGIRYWDMLRYDSDLTYAKEQVAYSGTVLDGGIEEAKVIDPANLEATQGLFQIPENEINLSAGKLEQNPGWE